MHETELIRVPDTPINSMTHPNTPSSLMPSLFEVLVSQFHFFIHFSHTPSSPSVPLPTRSDRLGEALTSFL